MTKEIWEEVYRHLKHIRDHFDYAEAQIIEVLRPALEVE
jgi:hypothetical protein